MFQKRRRSAAVLVALAMLATPVAPALAWATGAQAAPAPAPAPALPTWGTNLTRSAGWQHSMPLQAVPGEDVPSVRTGATMHSANWSGYIAGGSTFTRVAARWKVPTVQPSSGQEASATWIGIDGVTDRSLIQTGTAQDSSSGGTSYFAWAEVLPAAPEELGPVYPGDEMSASIVDSEGTWTISISDETEGAGASGQVAYDGPGSSAEWVEEAPTSSLTGQVLPLANFGTARFTGMSYRASAPRSVVLSPVKMVDRAGHVIATPGRIVNHAFTITYRAPPAGTPPSSGSTPHGYDLVGADGGVFVFGAGFYGSLPGLGIDVDDITGIVPTAGDDGYWLVGADGGVFAFDAPFVNSLPGIGVDVDDIVGIVPTRDDQGYVLVGRDGGVFSFNAPFENSLPGLGIQVDDIAGIATTPDDLGYWLVGSDGSVYAFGDAGYFGNAPAGAVAITATPDGGGYAVVAADGAVTPFGDARSFGDLPSIGVTVDDIVGIVVSPDGRGYNLIGSDGGVFSFGDAVNQGSLPGLGVHVDDVVGAVPT